VTKLIPLALAAALLTGCGGAEKPLPMAATPESARAALSEAFDGWKAGKGPKDFAAANPPLLFIDDEINRGTKLTEYRVEGDGTPRGTGYSFVVTLTLQTKDGKARTKRAAYTAVTEPNRAVTIEDRQP
jgi:hypothetical protein